MSPNPRVVSRELLTRDTFAPATSLNMLAAAWIQFMTRDWFSHGSGDINNPWQIPLPRRRRLPAESDAHSANTIADPTRPPDDTSAPTDPHQPSRRRGGTPRRCIRPTSKLQASVRTGSGGKLRLVPQGGDELLPPPLLDQLAQVPGWWLGLGLLLDALRARAQRDLRSTGRASIPTGPTNSCSRRRA